MPANPAIEAYIRDAAIRRGIDPETAVRVARAEALNVFDPNQPDLGGDDGSSFGPFQLHYAGMSRSMPNAGLGDEFTKATGLDARDPSTWKQQIDFSLDHAKRHGWRAWMGAKNTGIADWQGIKTDPGSYGGPGEGAGRTSGSPVATTATTAAAPADEVNPYQKMIDEFNAKRRDFDEPEQPRSLLADTMASSVRRDDSGGGLPTADQEPDTPPITDFATPAAPEALRETPAAPATIASDMLPLADIFKVAAVGVPDQLDPYTGQPLIARSRRRTG